MSHAFAEGGQAAELIGPRVGEIPRQGGRAQPGGNPPLSPPLSPALTPGKGVRQIRCVGCSGSTLPRTDDGAPLCQRCSDVLATGEPRTLPLRWFRRRDAPAEPR